MLWTANGRAQGRLAGVVAGLALLATGAIAQAQDPFGGFKHDSSTPIEITSDSLEVREAESIAIFSGAVEAGQGTLRLTAERMIVAFDPDSQDSETGAIKNVKAEGNVFLSNGSETAEGQSAEYDVVSGKMVMRGDVVLTQGGNAIAGPQLNIDLNTGVARIEGGATVASGGSGRVKAVFRSQGGTGG